MHNTEHASRARAWIATTFPRLTSTRAVRTAFWAEHPDVQRRPGGHNDQPTDTRAAFVDWLDAQERAGRVSATLAARVTL